MTRAETKHIHARAGTWAPWAESSAVVLALVLLATIARLVYLAWFNPYPLIEDEAHYWEWSRRLEWSYYSKGPGIAWAIAASVKLLGTSEFGVRAPAAIAGAIAALAMAGLARDAMGDKRAGFFAAVCLLLSPVFQALSLLSTIDMPYVACWMLAVWAAWRCLHCAGTWSWVGLGAAIGAGVLFKYTALLLVPGLLVYAVARRGRLRLHRRAGTLVLGAIAIGLLGIAPVVIWNAENGWPTVHHLLGHLGVKGGDMPEVRETYSPLWTLTFLVSQLGLAGAVGVLAVIGGVKALRDHDVSSDGPRESAVFLLLAAAPIFLFYLFVSFVSEGEANWAIAGHATLIPLAAFGLVRGMDRFTVLMARWRGLAEPRPRWGFLLRRPETATQVAWHIAIGIGLVAGIGMLRPDWASSRPGLGRYVPVARLTSATSNAGQVSELLASLREQTHSEPMVISQHYGRASQMAFYLPGRPTVFCSSSLMAGRRCQYDLWAETDLRRATGLIGRPAVLLGATREQWAPWFERVEEIGELRGEHKRGRPAFLGYGFKGIGAGAGGS